MSGACCSRVCRNLATDTGNCGSCGLACTNPHGTTACVGGACSPVCSSGWNSCDANLQNGCETSLTTLTSCGGCGVPCSLPNASPTCSTGSCAIAGCNSGYSNCDGLTGNGCEVSHALATGDCPAAPNVGTFDGDIACGFICAGNGTWDLFATRSGQTSAWFLARVHEGSNCPADIEHQIALDVPPGTDFDLYVYQLCGLVFASSTNGTGIDEVVTTYRNDDSGSDDSFSYWVEVRWRSGASCAPWTLQFYGHLC